MKELDDVLLRDVGDRIKTSPKSVGPTLCHILSVTIDIFFCSYLFRSSTSSTSLLEKLCQSLDYYSLLSSSAANSRIFVDVGMDQLFVVVFNV